jgi:oligosaccharide repeat unit polymerase
MVLVLAYFMIAFVGMLALWRYRRASPIFWFQGALTLMAVGTFPLVEISLKSDRTYLFLTFIAHIAFIAMVLTTASASRLSSAFASFEEQGEISPTTDEILLCVLMLLVSAAVTIFYYYLVGYNIVLLSLSGQLSGDYSDLRLATYSGDDYFAPGYVNQFKNVLLPLTVFLIGMRLYRLGRKRLLGFYILIGAPAVIVALAGTGQRAYVIYTFAGLAFGYFLHRSGRGANARWTPILFAAIPLLLLFVSLTSVYTESSDMADTISSAFARFTTIQQQGGLFGFQYIYPLPMAYFGEWWLNLKGIIPGVQGSTLDHEVFAQLYGSTRGTVPLTSIGSAYYNGGVLGVILLFLVLGFAYTLLYRRFLNGPRIYTRSYTYGLVFFYLSINVIDAPTVLLENGVLTALLFLGLLKFMRTGPAFDGAVNRKRSGLPRPKTPPAAAHR